MNIATRFLLVDNAECYTSFSTGGSFGSPVFGKRFVIGSGGTGAEWSSFSGKNVPPVESAYDSSSGLKTYTPEMMPATYREELAPVFVIPR